MGKIKKIIQDCKVLEIIGSEETEIKGIHFDSRKVEKGYLFVAVPGTIADGHD